MTAIPTEQNGNKSNGDGRLRKNQQKGSKNHDDGLSYIKNLKKMKCSKNSSFG
jgi:hypothetical protein